MYKTCIFDFYGTLCDIRTDERKPELWKWLANIYGNNGAKYAPDELMKSYFSIISEFECQKPGEYPEIRIERVFKELFLRKGVSADDELATEVGQLFRIRSTERLRLYDGAKNMLLDVYESGREVYLLSNAQRIFTEYELMTLDIYDFFDGIYISSDYGFRKPDPRFFNALIEEREIDPESAIMIGNDGTCDIAGAKAVGLHTMYIKSDISPNEPIPQADHVLMKPDMAAVGKILLKEGA